MSRVWMIRHGKPAANWGEAHADPDPGLDETGRAQAERVAAALMALPADERPTRVVTSPLRRCRETAAPLAVALRVAPEIVDAVAEVPTPPGLSEEARGPWLRRAMTGRWSDVEGAIDYDAWRRLVTEAVIGAPGAAVFSHFVAINAAVSSALNDPRVVVFRPDHVSVTVFDVVESRLKLGMLGAEAATNVL